MSSSERSTDGAPHEEPTDDDPGDDGTTLDVPVRKDPPPSETPEPTGPRHPDIQADLAERGDGAHAEQVTHEANLRADPDPPD